MLSSVSKSTDPGLSKNACMLAGSVDTSHVGISTILFGSKNVSNIISGIHKPGRGSVNLAGIIAPVSILAKKYSLVQLTYPKPPPA